MSSSSTKKVLTGIAGCGCVLLLISAVLLGGMIYATYAAVQKVREVASSVTTTSFEPSEIKKKVLPEGYEVKAEEMFEALSRPATDEDFDRFLATDDWFYSHPTHEKAVEAVAAFSNISSIVEGFEEHRELLDSHNELLDFLKDFNAYVSDNGGYTKQVDSAVRSVGVTASADAYGRAIGEDPWSNKVAQNLGEVALKARRAAEGDDDELKSLANEIGLKPDQIDAFKPGLLALAEMPSGSFQAWSDLKRPKRRKLIEAYQRQSKTVLAARVNPLLATRSYLGRLTEVLR